MSVCIDDKNAHGVPHLLQLHFKNLGGLLLKLNIKIVRYGPPLLTSVFDLIRALLFNPQYSRKIQVLHLRDAPTDWLSPISASFSKLEYFLVDLDFGHKAQHLFLDTIPLLSHVTLMRMDGNVSLAWSSITRLELGWIPIDACARLLTQCPNLTSFRSCMPTPPDIANQILDPYTVISDTTLHHMQDIVWPFYYSSWCSAVLHRVQVPALRTLTWSEGDEEHTITATHRTLFTKLPHTLHKLQLESLLGWTVPITQHAFDQCRYIRELVLMDSDKRSVYSALCMLAPGGGGRTKILPYLTSLDLGNCFAEELYFSLGMTTQVDDADFSLRVLEVCKGRSAEPGFEFKLRTPACIIRWTPAVQEELCVMIRAGFKLSVESYAGSNWLLL